VGASGHIQVTALLSFRKIQASGFQNPLVFLLPYPDLRYPQGFKPLRGKLHQRCRNIGNNYPVHRVVTFSGDIETGGFEPVFKSAGCSRVEKRTYLQAVYFIASRVWQMRNYLNSCRGGLRR
jgi:hypothetical protein